MTHPMIETRELNIYNMCTRYLITNPLFFFFFFFNSNEAVAEKQNKQAQLVICAKLCLAKLTSFALSV